MSDDLLERLAARGVRARAAMAGGTTLDAILTELRDHEQLNSIACMRVVMEMAAISLVCAKDLVSSWCEGRSYAHLTLADLDLLADTPRAGGVTFFLRTYRDAAIIDRKPYLRYARDPDHPSSVDTFTSSAPPPARPRTASGSISGGTVTFDRIRDDARRAAAAWPTEIRILRDEPDELLLHFLRAPSPS